MKKLFLVIILTLLCTMAAYADAPPIWQGDIDHFQDNDIKRWQSGRWSHQFHDHKMAWWWVIDDVWYAYNAASYPYPDPFTPAGASVDTSPNQGTRYRYYCSKPAGFYPYVNKCSHFWQRNVTTTIVVPAEPAAPVAQKPPPIIKAAVKPQTKKDNKRKLQIAHPLAPKKPTQPAKKKPAASVPIPASPNAPENLVPTDNSPQENLSRILQTAPFAP